jgi:hypothetical protein
LASLPVKHRWHSIADLLNAIRLRGFLLFGFGIPRNQLKTWSVFGLDYVMPLSDITQPLLEPGLLWPAPVLPREPISVIRAAIHFALKKNELPIAHGDFPSAIMRRARNMPSWVSAIGNKKGHQFEGRRGSLGDSSQKYRVEISSRV